MGLRSRKREGIWTVILSTVQDMRVEFVDFCSGVSVDLNSVIISRVHGEEGSPGGVQPQDLRCILQGFGARNVCSLSGRWCSKFCTEDEYIDEFATDVLGGFLQGARTTEVVLGGIRIKGRRPERR